MSSLVWPGLARHGLVWPDKGRDYDGNRITRKNPAGSEATNPPRTLDSKTTAAYAHTHTHTATCRVYPKHVGGGALSRMQ